MSLVFNNLLKSYNTISSIFIVQYFIFTKHMNLHVGLSIPPDRHNKTWKKKFKNHFVKNLLIKIAQENLNNKNSLISKYSWLLNIKQFRGVNPQG